MIMKIGITAGEIWNLLEKEEELKLPDLKERLEKSNEEILMSVGWLAREGHIKLEPEGDSYKLTLRR